MFKKIKKLIFIIFFALISCHTVSYKRYGTVHSKVDFSEGKWLMLNIVSPKTSEFTLTDLAVQSFEPILAERFFVQSEKSDLLIPIQVSQQSIIDVLQTLKKTSEFDFVIFIEASPITNELGTVQIGNIDNPLENKSKVTLSIYDVKLGAMVYSQYVIGTASVEESSTDLSFTTSSNGMLKPALKRILRKLIKNRKK